MGNLRFSERRKIPIYNDPDQITNGIVEVDGERCTGCGLCVNACPADALFLEDKLSRLRPPGINECMGCGDCTAICPEDAIVLVKGYEYTAHFKTIDRGSLMPPRLS